MSYWDILGVTPQQLLSQGFKPQNLMVGQTAAAQLQQKSAALEQLAMQLSYATDPIQQQRLNQQLGALQQEIAQLEGLAGDTNYMSGAVAGRQNYGNLAQQSYGQFDGGRGTRTNVYGYGASQATQDRFLTPRADRQPRINLGYGAQGRTGY